jgi:hypothetical protein
LKYGNERSKRSTQNIPNTNSVESTPRTSYEEFGRIDCEEEELDQGTVRLRAAFYYGLMNIESIFFDTIMVVDADAYFGCEEHLWCMIIITLVRK